jgi:hypothetical protein
MIEANPIPRRRRWPLVLIALLVVVGAVWAGGWGYGAGVAERTLEGWKAREAKAGRVYNCASQSIGGFPFGIEMRCIDASAELTTNRPPLALKAKGMLVQAELWKPTVLTTEFTGPLTVAQPGQSPFVTVRWQYARTELHGLPTAPESAVIRMDQPVVDRAEGDNIFKAERADLNARLVSGTVRDNPVIESVIKLAGASAQAWHPAAANPTDADITAVVRGLKDFAPKPWQQRLRELQAAGGRIEIVKARVQQGETIAVANGVLGLSPSGRLDGQLQLTIANFDRLLPVLGIDQMLAEQRASPKINNAFGALDRIMPGLGNVARQNAGPALVAGINIMGRPTELEGQRAVILPLRFDDGLVLLGPLKLGMTPPLY